VNGPFYRRTRIAQQLKRNPQESDRRIAATLGVSDKTVGAVRRQLESSSEIPLITGRIGADGKARKNAVRNYPMEAEIPHGTKGTPCARNHPMQSKSPESPPARVYGYTCENCGAHSIWQNDYGYWRCINCKPPGPGERPFQVINYGR